MSDVTLPRKAIKQLPWPSVPSEGRVATISTSPFRVDGKRAGAFRVRLRRSTVVIVVIVAEAAPFPLRLQLGSEVLDLQVPSPEQPTLTIESLVRRGEGDLVLAPHDCPADVTFRIRVTLVPQPSPARLAMRKRLEEQLHVVLNPGDMPSPSYAALHTAFVDDMKQWLHGGCTRGDLSFARDVINELIRAHDFRGAERLGWLVAAHYRQIWGPASYATMPTYGSLATALKNTGRAPSALVLEQAVHDVFERDPLTTDQEQLTVLYELAITHGRLGDRAQERLYSDRAEQRARALLGSNPGAAEIALTNAASVRADLGDYPVAVSYMQAVLLSRVQRVDPDSIELQRSRMSLAQYLLEGDIPGETEQLARDAHEALAQRAHQYPHDFRRATAILANALDRKGHEEDARTILIEALDQLPGGRDARLEHQLAGVLLGLGDLDSALEHCSRAHALDPQIHPPWDCNTLFFVHARRGAHDFCIDALTRRLAACREEMADGSRHLTPRDVDLFAKNVSRQLSLCISMTGPSSVLGETPELDHSMLEVICLLRALPLAANHITYASDPSVADAARQLFRSHKDLISSEQHMFESEARRRAATSGAPSSLWDEFADECRIDSIVRRLGSDSTFIAYNTYWRIDVEDTSSREEHVVAFVLSDDGRVHRHYIGTLNAVDLAVAKLLSVIDGQIDEMPVPPELLSLSPEERLGEVAMDLAQVVLAPVSAGLARSVWIMPDEALTMVPFDVLPLSRHPIAELHDVHVVCSTMSSSSVLRGSPNVMLVGDLDFESSDCPGFTEGDGDTGFAPLDGTQEEVSRVKALLEAHDGVSHLTVLRGGSCCRHVFLERAPEHSVVHVCTHGHFSIPPESTPADAPGASRRIPWQMIRPFDLAVLALSGARKGGTNWAVNTGLLRGGDVAECADLRDVSLCVVSACDSGVGVRGPAGGVCSLQRAFSAAGCGAVIGSVVTVPDELAAAFMEHLYSELLFAGRLPVECLQAAKDAWRTKEDAPLAAWAGWTLVTRGIETAH